MEQQLLPLLDAVFHPAATSDAKSAAEAQLRRLSRLPGAVPWAATALQPPASAAAAAPDHRLLYFAATVLDDAALRPMDMQRSALRACLWQAVLDGPHLPHFVVGKLATALAHLACVDFPAAWPDYWQQQQAALADASTLDRGLTLLAAVVEQHRALAATGATAAGAKGKARLVVGCYRRGEGLRLPRFGLLCCARPIQPTRPPLSAQVLSSQMPELQARYRQLQPAVLSTLVSLLQGLAPALPAAAGAGDRRLLSAAAKALQVQRSVIQDLPSLSQLGKGLDSASLAGLLADHALQALRLAQPGSPGEEGALATSAAAADCIYDLLTKHDDAAAAQRMLAVLLPKLLARKGGAGPTAAAFLVLSSSAHVSLPSLPLLVRTVPQELCDATQQRWAAGGSGVVQPEDPALASLVRLLSQATSTQLGRAEGSPELTARMLALLAAARRLMEARRSPMDMLLFLEPFHGGWGLGPGALLRWPLAAAASAAPLQRVLALIAAAVPPSPGVLSHLESLEDGWWELGGDEAAGAVRAAQASQALQAPLLDVARLLLATLLGKPVAPGQPAPPFTLAALDTALGSGAAADDLLQAVLSGGDAGEQAEEAAAGAASGGDEDEEEDRNVNAEVLVAPPMQQSPFQADSEVDVYVRHCEAFLARAVGTIPAELLPPLLLQLQAAQAGFAQVCEALAGQGGSVAGAAAALAQLDVLLRLLARAGPHLAAAGAAGGPLGPLVPSVRPSSAHAAQAFSAVVQLAATWLHAMQCMAAASPAEPSTPVHGRAGQLAGLSAFLAIGARIHKCLGALCATWLPQLMIAQAAANDSAAATDVTQLAEAQLQAAAAMLASLLRLPHWQGILHRVALAATQGLVALTSIAISSSMRPPVALLRASAASQHYAVLQQVAHASLRHSMLLPAKARRTLFVALSDLALRCWASQPASTFDAPSRAAQFGALVCPLLQCMQQAAAAALDAQLGAAALRATTAACSIVQVRCSSTGAWALAPPPLTNRLLRLPTTERCRQPQACPRRLCLRPGPARGRVHSADSAARSVQRAPPGSCGTAAGGGNARGSGHGAIHGDGGAPAGCAGAGAGPRRGWRPHAGVVPAAAAHAVLCSEWRCQQARQAAAASAGLCKCHLGAGRGQGPGARGGHAPRACRCTSCHAEHAALPLARSGRRGYHASGSSCCCSRRRQRHAPSGR